MAYVSVTIRKQDGTTTNPVRVKPESTTVGQLKSMVLQNIGVEAWRQRLTFHGNVMDLDHKFLSYYGVAANSTIDLEIAPVSVTIYEQRREATFSVEVTPETMKVRELKVMLAQQVTRTRAGRQRLTFNGNVMDSDDETLSYYGVAANSTIALDVEIDYGVHVRFKGGRAIMGDFYHEMESESSTSSCSD